MRFRSWSTAGVRFFEMEYEKVIERLMEYAEEVAKGARAVILTGSLASGIIRHSPMLIS